MCDTKVTSFGYTIGLIFSIVGISFFLAMIVDGRYKSYDLRMIKIGFAFILT